MFVDDFKNWIVDEMTGQVVTLEIGSGTTPESSSDTALESPISGGSVTPTVRKFNKGFEASAVFKGSDFEGVTISEVGLFVTDAEGVKTLVLRQTFQPFTLSNSDEVTIIVTGGFE